MAVNLRAISVFIYSYLPTLCPNSTRFAFNQVVPGKLTMENPMPEILDSPSQNGTKLHDAKQPLNVIRLAAGNIRTRVLPLLEPEDAAYLVEKLERIDRQVDRAAALLDGLAQPDA